MTPPGAAGLRRLQPNTQSDAWGYFCGCILALGASLSFATARAGVVAGLGPGDLILMRFGVSGLVLLPGRRPLDTDRVAAALKLVASGGRASVS